MMAVPMMVEAVRVARPGVAFGALLAKQLAATSTEVHAEVMARYPTLPDARDIGDPVVVAALEVIEDTVDRLLSAGFEFAGIAGAVR